jgi:hypothetical protein
MRLTNMTSTPQGPARSRWLLPVGAAAAVALVVAVVGVVAGVGGGKGPAQPPVLHLANVAGGSVGLSASPAAGASDKGGSPVNGAAPVSGARGSGWRLAGTLPKGPSTGRVYLLPAAATTRSFVSTLAGALGMSGAPQHLKGGWYVISGTTELSVSEQAGRHWSYSNHGCIVGPVLDPQVGTACAVAKSSPPILAPVPVNPDVKGPDVKGAPAPVGRGANLPPAAGSPTRGVGPQPAPFAQPIPVAENVARSLARPVLEAVGVSPAAAKVDTEGGQRNVVFSPAVEGSTVLGLDTLVSIDERGQIVDASGWLSTPAAGVPYPLISARQSYDQLLRQPQPMMALAMPCQILPGKADCAPIPDRVVTGATLGLMQAYGATLGLMQAYGADRGILLVPAWLFHVSGQSTRVAVLAVQPAFLGQPEPSSPIGGPIVGGQPGSAGGGAGSVGSQPGSVGGGPGSGGSQPGSVGGGVAQNGSTEATGAPTQLEQGGPATAPGTKPVSPPR